MNGSLAVDPLAASLPASKLALCTDRLPNAAWFTAVKSAGGSSTSARIPAQSWLAQSTRKAFAVVLGCGPELHALSAAIIKPVATAVAPR